ncbi:MAG TPA: hypothetical protein VF747_06665 [Blastocatellia bacterium]|jgi:hypothetical protein
MSVKCFYLEPANKVRRSLRRFESGSKCPLPQGYHDASIVLDEVPIERDERGYISNTTEWPHDDTRWPSHCACGYEFKSEDQHQLFLEELYKRSDTGEQCTLREAGPGAMWDAWWMAEAYKGPDGRCLVVNCPNGFSWMIDDRASNCTMPADNTHKCWIRHGEPPNITVDKNGVTCNAGAGSIQAGDYHGFLRDGEFT